jgi:2-hydroxychromene-2-carboxylate isomerase
MAAVTFYFDFGSPNAYLAHKVLPAIEQRTGATFVYAPVLLGGIFKLTGNQSPATAFAGIKNKLEYEALERQRFIARHGLTAYRFNPHFPINTLQLMRGAIAAETAGVFRPYVEAIFAALWEQELKMDDPAVFRAALDAAGLPAGTLIELSQSAPVKNRLLSDTEAAVARGLFGAPSFTVGDALFFGKDRLRDVEEEILQQPGRFALTRTLSYPRRP